MGTILVFGDITVDVLARLEESIETGGDNLVPELEQHCGGVGANTALALAKWGVPVRLLGCAGRDWFGDFSLGRLEAAGVDISQVERTERAMTGMMFITISPDGQRTIYGSRGANLHFPAGEGIENRLDGVECFHLMGYNFLGSSTAEASRQLVADAKRRGIRVTLDVGMAPSRQIPEKILDVAKRADILFVGHEEAATLTGQSDARASLARLEQCGAREIVVKRGEKGCVFLEKNAWCEVPPVGVTAVDTTGAGDAFAAAFLRARLRSWTPAEAALLANAAGAAAATVVGAGEQMPGPEKIFGLLENNRLSAEWEPLRRQVLQRYSQEFQPTNVAGRSGGQRGIGA